MTDLAFHIDRNTDRAVALFERVAEAERSARGSLVVERYEPGSERTHRRIREIGGRVEAYTFS